jgi:putative Mg2+ transporter-C (MgtC) family protein
MAAQVISGIGFLGAGVILREGISVHGINTAATLWCSAMVGTFAGAGFWWPSVLSAALVIATNLFLRPLVRRLNSRVPTSSDVETQYTVEITCKSAEEAHTRSLLLHALSQAGLGLRRIDSEDIPETSKVAVTAHAVTAKRNDAALEQIVGRLSLEPHVTAATWQVEQAVADT